MCTHAWSRNAGSAGGVLLAAGICNSSCDAHSCLVVASCDDLMQPKRSDHGEPDASKKLMANEEHADNNGALLTFLNLIGVAAKSEHSFFR